MPGFNTSHVTLYQRTGRKDIHRNRVSIHLMLLFIRITDSMQQPFFSFQYISCYSLSESITAPVEERLVSIHLTLLFINQQKETEHQEECFNTSHVTLYLAASIASVILMAWFQYISCYSLSVRIIPLHQFYSRFNTSHVTLYRG